jgi:Tfp pilus assembly protein PilV
MVLARVTNVKSGWKSMFMVFTTAAGDRWAACVLVWNALPSARLQRRAMHLEACCGGWDEG